MISRVKMYMDLTVGLCILILVLSVSLFLDAMIADLLGVRSIMACIKGLCQ